MLFLSISVGITNSTVIIMSGLAISPSWLQLKENNPQMQAQIQKVTPKHPLPVDEERQERELDKIKLKKATKGVSYALFVHLSWYNQFHCYYHEWFSYLTQLASTQRK